MQTKVYAWGNGVRVRKGGTYQMPPSEPRPAVSLQDLRTFLQAVTSAPKVSDEIAEERMETCRSCDLLRVDPASGEQYCSLCGCKVQRSGWQISLLPRYEEGPKNEAGQVAWGCKHPERAQGKGWKR